LRQLLKIITQFLPIALKAELNWRWNRILAMRDSLAPVERGAMSFPRHACYEHLREILPELDRPDAKAIEIGGSTGVIKSFFEQAEYVVAPPYPEADVQDLSWIEDESYDFVILDQVLEHVEDPWKAVEEVKRVLRDGGALIGTTPFFIYLHPVPRDYWRFTEDGLRVLLRSFSNVDVYYWGNRISLEFINRHGFKVRTSLARKLFAIRRDNEPQFPITYWFVATK